MTVLASRVAPGVYRDSIALMRLSSQLHERPGNLRAAVVMGTPANREALTDRGQSALAELMPDNVLLAMAGRSVAGVKAALDWAGTELRRPPPAAAEVAPTGKFALRTLQDGLQAAADPLTGVALFDIVLGHRTSPDPVGPLLAAVQPGDDSPRCIAHMVGLEADPQNLYQQEGRLRRASVRVAPTLARRHACPSRQFDNE